MLGSGGERSSGTRSVIPVSACRLTEGPTTFGRWQCREVAVKSDHELPAQSTSHRSRIGGLMTFENDVLKPVRTHLGRNIQVPAGGRWDVEQHADHLALNLEIDVGSLSRDFQTDRAALPSFLVCLSYWLERARGQKVTGSIRVLGEPPSESGSWLHWNRAAFLLDQLQLVLAGRSDSEGRAALAMAPGPHAQRGQ